jgi:hypothetical protein
MEILTAAEQAAIAPAGQAVPSLLNKLQLLLLNKLHCCWTSCNHCRWTSCILAAEQAVGP